MPGISEIPTTSNTGVLTGIIGGDVRESRRSQESRDIITHVTS